MDKNGEHLVLRNEKYGGGGLNDGYITITSITEADRNVISVCKIKYYLFSLNL